VERRGREGEEHVVLEQAHSACGAWVHCPLLVVPIDRKA
jgi:hypothetical protein